NILLIKLISSVTMNNHPKVGRPVFHAHHPNQHHAKRGHGYSLRPKPPSHSVAPWSVTQWIDPIEARKRNRRR
ncbi:unnamed protein product, partial [Rotaria sp. Silwood1]